MVEKVGQVLVEEEEGGRKDRESEGPSGVRADQSSLDGLESVTSHGTHHSNVREPEEAPGKRSRERQGALKNDR